MHSQRLNTSDYQKEEMYVLFIIEKKEEKSHKYINIFNLARKKITKIINFMNFCGSV